MPYALVITIAAGLALLALIAGATLLARRATQPGASGLGSLAGWRWLPSPLGLLLLLPLAALLLWRVFPALLFLPIIVPFFWRGRRFAGPARSFWNATRRPHPGGNGHGDRRTIEGEFRPVDEDHPNT
ncbi:MAG: hypothetical protein U1B78_04015 [Dehalococcoidia bacterium]|nr:hypothetical protein [Dehalococcoidia bacterium]